MFGPLTGIQNVELVFVRGGIVDLGLIWYRDLILVLYFVHKSCTWLVNLSTGHKTFVLAFNFGCLMKIQRNSNFSTQISCVIRESGCVIRLVWSPNPILFQFSISTNPIVHFTSWAVLGLKRCNTRRCKSCWRFMNINVQQLTVSKPERAITYLNLIYYNSRCFNLFLLERREK